MTFGVPCLVLQVTTGALIQNTVEANVNPFYVAVARELGLELLRTQWLPLALALVYVVVDARDHSHSRLLLLYWAASAVSLVGIGKIGANHNYWIEFAAATAMLAARGAASVVFRWRAGAAAIAGRLVVVLLAVQLGGPTQLFESLRGGRSDLRAALQAPPDPDFADLVERVRLAPGDVLAKPMDVIVLGGRPILLEPFIYSIQLDVAAGAPI